VPRPTLGVNVITQPDLDHSRPLDVHRWSDHPEANKFVGKIWREHFDYKFGKTGKGKRPKALQRDQLKVLLLDLYLAWTQDPSLRIGVGMAKSSYKPNSRYNALHISDIPPTLIHHAINVGLIEWKVGN
jgi:hypothetical protein